MMFFVEYNVVNPDTNKCIGSGRCEVKRCSSPFEAKTKAGKYLESKYEKQKPFQIIITRCAPAPDQDLLTRISKMIWKNG